MSIFSAILVAAGDSIRFGQKIKKPFAILNSHPVLYYSLKMFDKISNIEEIIVVGKKEDKQKIIKIINFYNIKKFKKFAEGSKTRQYSVFAGVKASSSGSTHVIIHDAARPLVTKEVIEKAIKFSNKYDALSVGTPLNDTIKTVDEQGVVHSTIDRKNVFKIQTPQIFRKKLYFEALDFAKKAKKNFTDDCSLLENIEKNVFIFEGREDNIKITKQEDLKIAENFLKAKEQKIRIGHGYDFHKLVNDRKLILGGIEIPHKKGLLGHSDADVLIHAIIDALLGAANLNDIGKTFPENDKTLKNISSLILLEKVYKKIKKKKCEIINIDSTIVAQEPKLDFYIKKMVKNIEKACCLQEGLVNIKATTEEGLSETGKEKAIKSYAVCLIKI